MDMDFYSILDQVMPGEAYSPYAAKTEDGQWLTGTISIDFLNANFSQYSTAQEMIDATSSEGLKLYFAWLKDQGKLP